VVTFAGALFPLINNLIHRVCNFKAHLAQQYWMNASLQQEKRFALNRFSAAPDLISADVAHSGPVSSCTHAPQRAVTCPVGSQSARVLMQFHCLDEKMPLSQEADSG